MRPYTPPCRYGRKLKKAALRPCEFLIYTAAKGKKKECGRATLLINTAANGKRQSCGRDRYGRKQEKGGLRPYEGSSSLLVAASPLNPELLTLNSERYSLPTLPP